MFKGEWTIPIIAVVSIALIGILGTLLLPNLSISDFTPGYDAEKWGYKGPMSCIDYFGFMPNPALVGDYVNDSCYLYQYIVDGSYEYVVIEKNFTGSKYLSNGYRVKIFEGQLVY